MEVLKLVDTLPVSLEILTLHMYTTPEYVACMEGLFQDFGVLEEEQLPNVRDVKVIVTKTDVLRQGMTECEGLANTVREFAGVHGISFEVVEDVYVWAST